MKGTEKTMSMYANAEKEIPVKRELEPETLAAAAGGHPFESSFGDINLYRCGVSYANTLFGSDEYSICNSSHQAVSISKDTAETLRSVSQNLWKTKYANSADFVGFAREWKQTLADNYGLDWDGSMGNYKFRPGINARPQEKEIDQYDESGYSA